MEEKGKGREAGPHGKFKQKKKKGKKKKKKRWKQHAVKKMTKTEKIFRHTNFSFASRDPENFSDLIKLVKSTFQSQTPTNIA